MSVKSEEIKVVISASAGELKRELTAAEREMMKARGVMEQEGGRIEANSKVWNRYRSRAAAELQKNLSDVERTQAKINSLLSKGPAIRESEMSAYEARLTSRGIGGEAASRMTMEAASRGDQLQELESILSAQKASVQELTDCLGALNDKVRETAETEGQEAQKAREATQAERQHAQAASGVNRSGHGAGSGIARIGLMSIKALIGVRTLYAGLRKLISATVNAASHNRTLANSLGQIKGNLSVMFQSIFQAALPALQTLASWLATVTNYVAQFTAMLFGVKWKTAVDGAKQASSGIGGVADSAKEASRALHQMGIDELNILDREEDASGGGGGGGGGIASVYSEPEDVKFEWLEKLKEKLQPIMEKVQAFLKNVQALWDTLKKSFLNAWEQHGERILNIVVGIVSDILDIVNDIVVGITEGLQANENGTRIYSAILIIWAGILAVIKRVTGFFKTIAKNIDWTRIITSVTTLFEEVAKLFGVLNETNTAFESFLGKTLGETFTSAVSSAAYLLAALIDLIDMLKNALNFTDDVSTPFLSALGESAAKLWGGSNRSLREIWSGVLNDTAQAAEASPYAQATKESAMSFWENVRKADQPFPWTGGAVEVPVEPKVDELDPSMFGDLEPVEVPAAPVAEDAPVSSLFEDMEMPELPVDADTAALLQTVSAALTIVGSTPAVTPVEADTSPALASVEAARAAIDAMTATITVHAKYTGGGSVPGAAGGGIIHAAKGGIIPRLASGGSLGSSGQLFIAREAGPELVAGIGGGRTAVMNNNQIVQSVSEGVYKAVKDALADGSFDVNVISRLVCDSREIAKASEKGRASLGRRIGSRAFS